jgi:hypothetical protein
MTAQEYRNHAGRRTRLAREAVTPEMREGMSALADRWMRLAQERDQDVPIAYKRGKITVLDLHGLRSVAWECCSALSISLALGASGCRPIFA